MEPIPGQSPRNARGVVTSSTPLGPNATAIAASSRLRQSSLPLVPPKAAPKPKAEPKSRPMQTPPAVGQADVQGINQVLSSLGTDTLRSFPGATPVQVVGVAPPPPVSDAGDDSSGRPNDDTVTATKASPPVKKFAAVDAETAYKPTVAVPAGHHAQPFDNIKMSEFIRKENFTKLHQSMASEIYDVLSREEFWGNLCCWLSRVLRVRVR